MIDLTHEKYVSIEYSVWQSKYKPMEDELQSAKEELEKREIVIHVRRELGYGHGYNSHIGRFTVAAQGGDYIDWFDKHGFEKELQYAVDREVTRLRDEIEEANRKIKSLPKLVRWLFGIKTV